MKPLLKEHNIKPKSDQCLQRTLRYVWPGDCEKYQVNYFLSYILRDPKKVPEIAQKSVKN